MQFRPQAGSTVGSRRSLRFPGVPTLEALGYDAGIGAPGSVATSAGLPVDVQAKRVAAFPHALQPPAFQATLDRFDNA